MHAEAHTLAAQAPQQGRLIVVERSATARGRVEVVVRDVRHDGQQVGDARLAEYRVEALEALAPVALGLVERPRVRELVDSDEHARQPAGLVAEQRPARPDEGPDAVAFVAEPSLAHAYALSQTADGRRHPVDAHRPPHLGMVELGLFEPAGGQLRREQQARAAQLVARHAPSRSIATAISSMRESQLCSAALRERSARASEPLPQRLLEPLRHLRCGGGPGDSLDAVERGQRRAHHRQPGGEVLVDLHRETRCASASSPSRG